MTGRQPEQQSLPHRLRYLLGAVALLPVLWQVHAQPASVARPHSIRSARQIVSQAARQSDALRVGLGDHLADIAGLTSHHNRQVDLRGWERRVNFLSARPGITDIRVDVAPSDVATYAKSGLVWNTQNLSLYGAAFDYARARKLNIIVVAMPPLRQLSMTDAQYQSMISAYYDRLGIFARAHGVTDINLNELGAHNPATGAPVRSFTPRYVAQTVSLVATAWHAIERRVPRAQLVVSESAAMTEEATRRLLAVFAALTAAGIPFIRGLNIYAGGHVEIAEIAPLIEQVEKAGEVWVTEFAFTSAGVGGERRQAKRIGQIFERVIAGGARVVIAYEAIDEPRLQRLNGVSAAEKHYGIVWRADGTLKPAADVFFALIESSHLTFLGVKHDNDATHRSPWARPA